MGCAASANRSTEPHDEAKERGKYDEEQAEPLPDGDIGDCMLGVTVS